MKYEMIMALSILMIVVAIAFLIYWIKSLIVMSKNTLFLILGIFFSPIAQLAYFFGRREEMDDDQATTMKRFFMVTVAYFVLAIILIVVSLNSVMLQGMAVQ